MKKLTHTPEPWETSVNEDRQWDICEAGGGDMIADLAFRGHEGEADAKRIAVCVNACEGMKDPEAEVKALREALADLRAACTDVYKQGRIPAEPFVRAGNVL